GQAFRENGIALEVLSTPAACRTWNVLMSEGRIAAAALVAI
ncbi:MAG: Mth938-like domain-containing protein, partial [Pseudomonadota bacterium]|nr:Mth938-like domain-containing protein [Pseudomonadota bacterium]